MSRTYNRIRAASLATCAVFFSSQITLAAQITPRVTVPEIHVPPPTNHIVVPTTRTNIFHNRNYSGVVMQQGRVTLESNSGPSSPGKTRRNRFGPKPTSGSTSGSNSNPGSGLGGEVVGGWDVTTNKTVGTTSSPTTPDGSNPVRSDPFGPKPASGGTSGSNSDPGSGLGGEVVGGWDVTTNKTVGTTSSSTTPDGSNPVRSDPFGPKPASGGTSGSNSDPGSGLGGEVVGGWDVTTNKTVGTTSSSSSSGGSNSARRDPFRPKSASGGTSGSNSDPGSGLGGEVVGGWDVTTNKKVNSH